MGFTVNMCRNEFMVGLIADNLYTERQPFKMKSGHCNSDRACRAYGQVSVTLVAWCDGIGPQFLLYFLRILFPKCHISMNTEIQLHFHHFLMNNNKISLTLTPWIFLLESILNPPKSTNFVTHKMLVS